MAQRHGIKRNLVAKVVVVGGSRRGRQKLDGMSEDLLRREQGRGKPRLDVSLPRWLTVAIVRAMGNLKEHA